MLELTFQDQKAHYGLASEAVTNFQVLAGSA